MNLTARQGLPEGGLRRVILTASGGAFRDWDVERLASVKVLLRALRHAPFPCHCCPSMHKVSEANSATSCVSG